MVLEAIIHSQREGMENPLLAKLQAMEAGAYGDEYEDEGEDEGEE